MNTLATQATFHWGPTELFTYLHQATYICIFK